MYADGSNLKLLSRETNDYSRGIQLGGGSIVDWLPDEDGAVLMSRVYIPDEHTGSLIGSSKRGVGVDYVDTRTLQTRTVEPPKEGAVAYISDGRGSVRVMGIKANPGATGQDTGVIEYLYRTRDSQQWQKLSEYNGVDRTGFQPSTVDRDKNVVYGWKKLDGRLAVYAVSLDASLSEVLISARPDVDVDEFIHIGRRERMVGISFATETGRASDLAADPDLQNLMASLAKALPPQSELNVVDSSVDESKLLILATRDNDPGTYYLFDRPARKLRPLLAVRDELSGVTLANVKAITYPAADGTRVPGYITFPAGKEDAEGLPAIVLPHGGPSARDEWGFNWLAQFYAARGYVVLQPNFRGSTGYGDAWYEKNGFKSWSDAIGDILDGGRWLEAQGIADPGKLGIVGWSYGGYAALQAAVTGPAVFKAVVAIAPVTDLDDLKEESRHWSNHQLIGAFVGDEANIGSASPARNADKIKVPVLLFHGALDRNVAIGESQHMARSLKAAGVPHQLVTWDNLDHQLDDSNARADMLRKSDAFLRQAFGP